jgi:hypothetical protein
MHRFTSFSSTPGGERIARWRIHYVMSADGPLDTRSGNFIGTRSPTETIPNANTGVPDAATPPSPPASGSQRPGSLQPTARKLPRVGIRPCSRVRPRSRHGRTRRRGSQRSPHPTIARGRETGQRRDAGAGMAAMAAALTGARQGCYAWAAVGQRRDRRHLEPSSGSQGLPSLLRTHLRIMLETIVFLSVPTHERGER